MKCCAVLILLAGLGSGRVSAQTKPAPEKTDVPSQHRPTNIEMANVLFRYSPSLTIFVVRLRGEILPTQGHVFPSFNDPASFIVATDAAEMRMTTAQLSALMNTWLLRSPKAQLKNVQIQVQGHQLLIHGTMKKGLHFPFQATADVGLTNDNRIRITAQQVKAAHLPVKGVLDAFGLSMEDLVSQKGLHGLSVDKDSFLIDPQTAFPPPQIHAKLTRVYVAGDSLVISFGQGAPRLSTKPWKNYIFLHGGVLQYGREQMMDADLTMIDSTPADPFEFDLENYWCQIVAGTIKAQPDKSMRVFMPDYSKLRKSACRH